MTTADIAVTGAAALALLSVVQTDWADHPWLGGGYATWARPCAAARIRAEGPV